MSTNQIDFGGTGTTTSIYFGYQSVDDRPIPTDYFFGNGNGSANVRAKAFYENGTAISSKYWPLSESKYSNIPLVRLNDAVISLHNIISYREGGTHTGCIVIELPISYDSCAMLNIEIDLFVYNNNQSTKIIVSGYNYTDGVWYHPTVYLSSNKGINRVRWAYNTSTKKACLILGETTTRLEYPCVNITRISCSHNIYSSLADPNGYKITFDVTSLSGYTFNGGYETGINDGLNADYLDGYHANSFALSSHTHSYAGSSSAGGSATSAVKLATARTISIGGATNNFDGSGNISWGAKLTGVQSSAPSTSYLWAY